MGMDIHTYICDEDGVIKYRDIWEGRNSDFFADLSGNGYDRVYEKLDIKFGLSECAEFEIPKKEQEECFNFRHIRVGDFIKWFEVYRPDVVAGWCTKYEAWLYKNKDIAPYELNERLYEDDVIGDREFIVIEKKYDCAKDIYKFFKRAKR